MSAKRPKRNTAALLSNALFALVLVVAAIVAYLYFFDDRFFSEGPSSPACASGQNELICVLDALKEQDFDRVEPGRYTASANQLTQPGQVIEINDQNAFLFVYPTSSETDGVAAREQDAADLDTSTLEITSRSADRPLVEEGDEIHVFQQSNVILVLIGGTDEEIRMVEAAMATLP